MLSCGSVSFGKRQCLAFQRVRGKGSLFSNSPAPGFAAAAARPLAGCLPAKQPGSRHPKQVGSGASSAPSRGARGWKKEGKCNTPPGESPVRPPKRNPRSRLPCNSTEIHPPSLSPEITASHMGQARASGFSARSAARRPVPALAARGRCPCPGQCEPDAPARRRRCPSRRQQLPRRAIPARAAAARPARLRVLHLGSVTCRLRHQRSVLR